MKHVYMAYETKAPDLILTVSGVFLSQLLRCFQHWSKLSVNTNLNFIAKWKNLQDMT